MPDKKREQPELTELEKRILERQLKEQLGITEPFWRETLLEKPMPIDKIPTPIALPYEPPSKGPPKMTAGTKDNPIIDEDRPVIRIPSTEDPMPFTNFDPQRPIVSYL
jgi:hypothetical protein